MTLPIVTLKSGKEQSLNRFHPWVFSGAIKHISQELEEGELVTVVSNKDEFLAIGHFQVGSIAVRILSFEELPVDNVFWENKLASAVQLRRDLGLLGSEQTNVFRLVHGEGDGLPGLIIDFYNGTAVYQAHSVGMYHVRHQLAKLLKKILGDQLIAMYDKSDKTLPYKADISPENGYLLGESAPCVVKEYGLSFQVDWIQGQKTGFFIDQRENRKLVEQFSAERDVLNMFCYSGGFSFFAMQGGAKTVHSVDASAKAIELTRQNVALNFVDDKRHEAFVADAFDFMRDIKDRYNLIILDPPAFAKHRGALRQALQAYKRLNAKAFEQVRPGGIIFTFSCSQVVTKDQFREAVFSGAAISKRKVRILHQLHQPADHPINIYHPEGEYLKGLVLQVD
ncbi:class I SAM-dependent rRNA methyltransferase [Sunxiuqinia elliptica]|uniref:SAM-dependent methyltransferase n=1 Tax=Sunxiuqinia elliptica TaxID=655355 RepID=A0A4R6GX31_9BACT|nr:class I SAM-dependent rRNA methyltransferase [Sunxiuqinia elliptica]TDN99877.1 SAM-dependent methyltransferase [Sunxiuqinia elliptica]TDO57069.1 SAM-dependent methyltransferase [Sunxiuqinia elliptica]